MVATFTDIILSCESPSFDYHSNSFYLGGALAHRKVKPQPKQTTLVIAAAIHQKLTDHGAMAAPASASSSLFIRLADIWRNVSLRSDVDNIILELLGKFSLEKIYSEGDKQSYQQLVVTLLAQLNAIYYIQRLSLPCENVQVSWYLAFLASWEVTLRSVEFVLQTVLEGRESLWEAPLLRDKYLAEVLLSTLRILTLHPKAPQRAKDRRDRFARIHRSLEGVFDSYPGPKSFLLLVCKEMTDTLRKDPDALPLPPRLRYELPNLASELVREMSPLMFCDSCVRRLIHLTT